jgi:hypothetical protein
MFNHIMRSWYYGRVTGRCAAWTLDVKGDVSLFLQWRRATPTSCGGTSSRIWRRPCRPCISETSPGRSIYVTPPPPPHLHAAHSSVFHFCLHSALLPRTHWSCLYWSPEECGECGILPVDSWTIRANNQYWSNYKFKFCMITFRNGPMKVQGLILILPLLVRFRILLMAVDHYW